MAPGLTYWIFNSCIFAQMLQSEEWMFFMAGKAWESENMLCKRYYQGY